MIRRNAYGEEDVEERHSLSRRAVLGALGIVAAAGGTALAGYGAFSFGLFKSPPQIEIATGCRADAEIGHTTVALVDLTDPLTDIHGARLRSCCRRHARCPNTASPSWPS